MTYHEYRELMKLHDFAKGDAARKAPRYTWESLEFRRQLAQHVSQLRKLAARFSNYEDVSPEVYEYLEAAADPDAEPGDRLRAADWALSELHTAIDALWNEPEDRP